MGEIGEIAKAVTPLLDNLAKLTGPMLEEIGLYLGDKVRAFRQRNMATVFDGTIKRLDEAGKPIGPVPARLLIPIVEAASLEDNPTIQDMWSGLLASASNQADNMSPSYTETLKVLTPIEARSLKVLFDFLTDSYSHTLGTDEDVSFILTDRLGLAVGESVAPELVIETLERLGLIRREYDLSRNTAVSNTFPTHGGVIYPSRVIEYIGSAFLNPGQENPEPLPKVVYDLAFTSYGWQFMRACQGPT